MSEVTVKGGATIGDRLRHARVRLGYTQQEVADMGEISRRTLSRYENSEVSPSSSAIRRIGEALGIPYDWLMHGKGDLTLRDPNGQEASQNSSSQPPPSHTIDFDLDSRELLPVVRVKASAGDGEFVVSEDTVGYVKPDPNSPFYEIRRGSSSVYYMPIEGDSMEPILTDGELVPVKRFQGGTSEITWDAIYVYRYEGAVFVKRLMKESASRIRVISDNEAYPEQLIDLDDGTDFEVLGRVLV